MKLSHFIPPAIALILIGSWIGPQRLSIAGVEAECDQMRTTIAAAESWFDRQIAAGKFATKALGGVSHLRQKTETAVIGVLLASSPDAAARRIGAIQEEQRGDVLRMDSLTTVPPELQVAHAKLVRAAVPTKD